MAAAQHVIDVGDDDFEREVAQRSHQTPVVVDFWAPWCGPCRALGPLLERIASESDGAFVLAKVNVDLAQAVAGRFEVRSIPLVIGFRGGEPVGRFVGAQPESEVRRFVAGLVPSRADRLAAEGDALALRDPEGAEARYRSAIDMDPLCGAAKLGLARLQGERDQIDEALALLESLVGDPALEKEADRLAAALRTRAPEGADEASLRAQLVADPADLGARIALGRVLAGQSRHEDALTELIEAVRRDPDYEDAAARKAVLDLLEVLGADDPLTDRFRRELAGALYR